MKLNNKDVDIKYDASTIHCWIEPNILTYDRPTLEWINNEVINSSLFLLGNGDNNIEGKQLKNKIKNIYVAPWIFWPRKPMLMEKMLNENKILDYEERKIEYWKNKNTRTTTDCLTDNAMSLLLLLLS